MMQYRAVATEFFWQIIYPYLNPGGGRHTLRTPGSSDLATALHYIESEDGNTYVHIYLVEKTKILTELKALLGQIPGLHDCASVVPPVWGGQSEAIPVEHSLKIFKKFNFFQKHFCK